MQISLFPQLGFRGDFRDIILETLLKCIVVKLILLQFFLSKTLYLLTD